MVPAMGKIAYWRGSQVGLGASPAGSRSYTGYTFPVGVRQIPTHAQGLVPTFLRRGQIPIARCFYHPAQPPPTKS